MVSFAASSSNEVPMKDDSETVSEYTEISNSNRNVEQVDGDKKGIGNDNTVYVSSGEDTPTSELDFAVALRKKLYSEVELHFQTLSTATQEDSIDFDAVWVPFFHLLEGLNRYMQLCTLSQFVETGLLATYHRVIPETLSWLLKKESAD